MATVALCSGAVAGAATRHGPLITPDGVVYLAAADSVRHGRGAVVPFTSYTDAFDAELVDADGKISAPLRDFPPGFPALVAGVSRLSGAEPTISARWCNVVLLTVNSFLIGLVTLLLVGLRRWWRACAAQVVALFALIVFPGIPGLLFVHVAVLAEPAMLACTLIALLCSLLVLRRWSVPLLVAATTAAAAATLFRFIGLAALVAVAFVAVRRTPGRTANRWLTAGAVMAGGAAPAAMTRLGTAAGSPARWHVPEASQWQNAAAELAAGVATLATPTTLPAAGSWAIGAAVAVCLADAVLSPVPGAPLDRDRRSGAQLLAVFAVAYLGVLVMTRLVADRWVPLQGRLLVPVMVVAVIAAAGLGRPGGRRALALGLAGLLVVIPGAVGTVHWVPILGAGRPQHLAPPLADALAALPGDVVVVTDQPDSIHLATGRTTMMVPCRDRYFSGAENHAFDHERAQMLGLLRDGRGVLLLGGGPDPARGCFGTSDAETAGLEAAVTWQLSVLYR